ncbi:uncharacterized protein LOC124132728 [Haliotis rufescens]|uniref:uncharacterized protein LOC124132728 n=1 Tax=Haliotis rufescens TaxID=6454 RepID=UPI00201EC848|nr:uncharacterized protein LOC124132728 [Haliotis rufescens]
MATKGKGLTIDVGLYPWVTTSEGGKSDISDIKAVYDILKDVHLLQTHLRDENYFKLTGVESDGKFITLKCLIFDLWELKSLSKSVEDGSLGKKLSNYATEKGLKVCLGLEVCLGLRKTEVSFQLDITKRDFIDAERFLKKTRCEYQDNSRQKDNSENQGRQEEKISDGESQDKRQRSLSKSQNGTGNTSQGAELTTCQQGRDTQLGNTTVVDTEFYVFVASPSNNKRIIDKVEINVLTIGYQFYKMDHFNGNIWRFAASLPSNVETVSYMYQVCYLGKGRFWNSHESTSGLIKFCKRGTVNRDFFDLCDISKGYIEHVAAIILRCTSQGLKDSIIEVDNLSDFLHKCSFCVHLKDILEELKEYIDRNENNVSRDAYAVLSYMFGKLIVLFSISNRTKHLNTKICMEILHSFQAMMPESVPENSLGVFAKVAEYIIHITSPEEKCKVLKLLEFAFPFLPTKIFIRQVSECIKNLRSKSLCEDVDYLSQIIRKISGNLCRDREGCRELLLKILTHSTVQQVKKLKDECATCLSKEEIEDLFEMKVMQEMKYAGKQRHFVQLLDLYVIIGESSMTDSIHGQLKRTCLTMITDSQIKDDLDVEAAMKLVTFQDLFSQTKDRTEVLKCLAGCKNVKLHQLFINLLRIQYLDKDSTTDVIAKWAKCWLDTAISNLGVKRSYGCKVDDLEEVYLKLELALSLPQIAEMEDLTKSLKNKTFDFLQQISVHDLLDKLSKVDVLQNSTVLPVFQEHLQGHLFKGNNRSHRSGILSDITNKSTKDGKVYVCRRLHARIIVLGVNYSGLAEDLDDIDALILMLQNWQFWSLVFNIEGEFQKDIMQNPLAQKAKKIARVFKSKLENKTLLLKFMKKLIDAKNKNIDGFCKILVASSSNTDYETMKGELTKHIEAITVAERDQQLLTKVLKKISSFDGIHVPDANLAQDILKMKVLEFQQGDVPMQSIFDQTHWEPFTSFLTCSETVATVVQSGIYWQVCMESTKEWLSKMDVNEIDTAADPVEDICCLFGNTRVSEIPEVTLRICGELVKDGLSKYKKIWGPLFKEEDANLGCLQIIVDTKDMKEEIRIAERIFKADFPEWIVHAFEIIRAYSQYDKKLKVISKVVSVLQHNAVEDESFTETVHAFSALRDENFDHISLFKLRHIRKLLDEIEKLVTDDLQHVLNELSTSKHLIDFLKDKPMDDLRNLIDAVEEHSEQSIQESTVSALIAVKRFLSPLMHSGSEKTVLQVLTVLSKSVNDSQVEKLAEKISVCKTHLHGLKALFNNVANRGEMTKDVVKNTLKKGAKFSFMSDEKGCSVRLAYKSHGVHTTHTRTDLNDLRSRVLLMVNTEANRKTPGHQKDKVQMEYESFIMKVDEAIDIGNILDRLRQSGYPDCKSLLKGTLDISHLEAHREHLETTWTIWQSALSNCRQTHYWLNFFYPEQLRTIHLFLEEGTDETTTRNLLGYTGCKVEKLNSARMTYQTVSSVDMKDTQDNFGLKTVGITLDRVLSELTCQKMAFPKDTSAPKQPVRIADAVQPGNIFVASLDENSSMVIPTVLALYQNTTGLLPLPHQLLFCLEDTHWGDIELLLNRCHGSQNLTYPQLFVIVSVEKLSNDVQFQLVECLKRLAYSNVLMAVVCEGSHHPFLDHFGERVNQVQPLSESSMETCLQNLFPNVITVTSDLPGQGKSETIQELAHTENLDVCTLHLSGDVTPPEMIRKLRCLDLSPFHVLHIDIGLISSPFDLEKLLFQLIVLKTISHKSDLFTLVTNHVYIEIANTIDSVLRNSLQTVTFFKREHVRWQNYDNFCVSQEICSPVQVVCNFLNVYDKGEMDIVDLYFSGEKQCKPLKEQRCQELLRYYFSYDTDLSFTIVQVFLNLLADQLKKFSCSHYFRTQTVAGMLGTSQVNDVKTQVLKALLEMSKEFAARSVQSSRQNISSDHVSDKQQIAKTLATAHAMTQRVDSMIQWSQSNHLIVAFHNQDIHTLTALYRSKQMVEVSVRKLFETQIGRKMPEFSDLHQTELQKILQHVARFKQELIPQEELKKIDEMYALTPDNLLKMVLIVLRVRAHIPVILMGDTGCGKTSLIHYLSKICGVVFRVQNIHAGVEESDLVDFVLANNAFALSNMNEHVWVFLDEINTCNHLGLINDIICHHCCQGRMLAPNLIAMAACNPYKLRTEESIFTAGLDNKVVPDEQSKLVYRVNPLPESMVDYIWDYGSLSKTDEESYIRRMIYDAVSKHLVSCLVELLTMSQEFIRKKEQSSSCVSLRDVNRCRILIKWFQETLKMKIELLNKCLTQNRQKFEIKAVILALAHVYHSRLPDTSSRKEYRENMSRVFERHGDSESETDIFKIIHEEQRDIIRRMELPDGIAKNTALQENVFVIMISILNRIPIFVVGKPGCSKSLSLQLIKSNLRGHDSTDPYFQKLPQLYCVAFQGSESSTSDGIIKVFEKAERYRESTKEENVLPVVILDEIGLAETSKFNPLKVLHSRLEP